MNFDTEAALHELAKRWWPRFEQRRNLVSGGMAILTSAELTRMVDKALATPNLSPTLAATLDMMKRLKATETQKAERHEAFRQLGKCQDKRIHAERGDDWFIEGKRIEAAKPPEPYAEDDARRWLGFGQSVVSVSPPFPIMKPQ